MTTTQHQHNNQPSQNLSWAVERAGQPLEERKLLAVAWHVVACDAAVRRNQTAKQFESRVKEEFDQASMNLGRTRIVLLRLSWRVRKIPSHLIFRNLILLCRLFFVQSLPDALKTT